MKNKKIVPVIICFVSSVFVILAINEIHLIKQNRKNGFSRKIISDLLIYRKVGDIRLAHYYIAGVLNNNVILGNFGKSGELLYSDFRIKKITRFQLQQLQQYKIAWGAARFFVNFNKIFLAEGITPAMLTIGVPDEMARICKIDSPGFDKLILISPSSFVTRTFNIPSKSNILLKRNISPPLIKYGKNILQNQQDGIFSTDGMFIYDALNSSLVYLYYYRNEYIYLDTNINVLARCNTIDTNTRSKISLSEIKGDKQIIFSSPPLKVNKTGCICNNKLFILSSLCSDNENQKNFKENSIIDVYNMINHSYLYSFYLPDLDGKKMNDFIVYQNTLIALQDHYIVSYQFSNDNK